MSIQVTPIPRLTVLTVPAFTLGTANAAGSAATAIASDSTLLVYDTTLPDAITYGQSGAVGSATTVSHRDHAHAMAAADATDPASEAEQVAGSSTTVYTSPGRQQFHPSAAKVWVMITAAGAITSPDYGTASVTDVDTGNYTIVFDEDFATAVYSPVQMLLSSQKQLAGWTTFAVGSFNFSTVDIGGSNQDAISATAIYGVLA